MVDCAALEMPCTLNCTKGSNPSLSALSNSRQLRRQPGVSAICALVVSQADSSIITGGDDTTIRQWDPSSGRELSRIGTHRRPVHDLAISDDGRSPLSASLDGMVRLWDLNSCRERLRLVVGEPDAMAMVWDLLRPTAPAVLELDVLWSDLADGTAGTAYRSIGTMTAVPDRTVTSLSERLRPISSDVLVKDTSLLPVATGETLPAACAIAVLEKIGTLEAQHQVLERLATSLDRLRPAKPGPRCGDWSKNPALSSRP